MTYELELLETLADWLKKNPTINEHDVLLQDETKRLEKVMLHHLMSLTNKTQLKTYLQINLYKLTEICDSLYAPESKDNVNATLVMELLEKLRKTVFSLSPDDLQLPLLLRKINGDKFEAQWKSIKNQLTSRSIDPLLIDIIAFAYHNYVRSRPMWSNDSYLHFFTETLEDLPEKADTDTLVNLLISLGYNYSRFTVYCFRWMRQRFEGKNTDEKSKLLLSLKKEMRQLELLHHSNFDSRKQSILDELLKWVDEELSNAAYEQTALSTNPLKINTRMKVLELAYWEKLQYDHGIYEEINLDILSEKVAFNFTSKGQDELSASSIKSKFYPKDRAIIAPVEEMLVKMLEDVRQFMR